MTAILTITMNPALDLSFEVERMIAEEKLRGSALVSHPGGGGINVARVVHRLGGEALAVWIGGGGEGTRLGELLDEEGVRHHQVPAREPVRLSIHVEERATTAMYRFVLPGPALSAAELEAVCEHVTHAPASLVVLSGSLPQAAPTDFYARLSERVPAGVRVLLDTSGEPLAKGLAGTVYLAKPNRNELGKLVGRTLATRDDVIAAARETIARHRVEVLCVSLAEEGLVLVTRDTAEHLRAPPVEMVSAVGAGDSTVAGIAVGLARGLPLVDAVRLGVAAGTAAVLSPGSELCSREDTERLFPQIRRV